MTEDEAQAVIDAICAYLERRYNYVAIKDLKEAVRKLQWQAVYDYGGDIVEFEHDEPVGT